MKDSDNARLHLTGLPVEICQKIAAYLPARTILCLAQTCRYLRAACHHPIVLQGSFMNHLDYPSSSTALVPSKEGLRNLIVAQLGNEPTDASSVWGHLAFAASHLSPPSPALTEYITSIAQDDDYLNRYNEPSPAPPNPIEGLINLVGTLSTFAILGLPATVDQLQEANKDNTSLNVLLTNLAVKLSWGPFYLAQDPTHRVLLAAQTALCLGIASLRPSASSATPDATGTGGSKVVEYVASAFGIAPQTISDPLVMAITTEWPRSLAGGQAIGLLSAASTAHLLLADRAVRERDDLPKVEGARLLAASKKSKGTIHLPIPAGDVGLGVLWAAEISLGTALRGYGAKAGPTYARWLRESLDALIDDLASGDEWVGYYTYDAAPNVEVDAPLKGIRFTTEVDPDDEADWVLLKAEGCTDGVGEFALDGKLSRSGGWVTLHKTYTQAGFSWINRGWLTPLGIAGYWGREEDGYGLGFVWMYKKEWTKNAAGEKK